MLFKAYITAHKIDIIYLSETYPDSSIKSDNDNLEIPGYNLVCSNHPSNNKRSGVSMQYTTSLPHRVFSVLPLDICFLQELITFGVMTGDKECNFIALYRSSSQNQDEFDFKYPCA